MRRLILVVMLAGTSVADAQPIAGCVKALNVCTLERAQQLQTASDKLAAAAAAVRGKSPPAGDKAKVQAFNDWLQSASGKLRSLADRGKGAADEANQKAFNTQFLQMQQDMQRQVQAYQALSNIIKSEHDMAKQAIQNIR